MDINNLIGYVLMATVVAMVFWFLGYLTARKKMPEERADAIRRSRSVLSGQFSEQLAPYLPDFPFKPNEVKFIGKPIDFLVFKGMDEKEISEVVFVEVKSGNSRLTSAESRLREAIENKRVSWQEYRIPQELTKRPETPIPTSPEKTVE